MFLSLLFVFAMKAAAQKPNNDITLLADPKEENVFIARIDDNYFLLHNSDIGLINKRSMESIELHGPDREVFKQTKEKYPSYFKKVKAVFVIKMKEGAKLPDKFEKKNNK